MDFLVEHKSLLFGSDIWLTIANPIHIALAAFKVGLLLSLTLLSILVVVVLLVYLFPLP